MIGFLFNLNRIFAGKVLIKHTNQIFSRDAGKLADHSLNIAWEHIDGGNDETYRPCDR